MSVAAPLALKLTAITIFLPEQLSFFAGGLRLTAARVALLALVPVLLIRLGSMMASGRYRFVLSDLFVLLAGVWMFLGPSEVVGMPDAVSHSGPVALEFCVGYLAPRVLLSGHGQAISFIKLLCSAIAVVGILGPLDPLAGRFVVRDMASAVTGYPVVYADNLFRAGLLRATGPLEHSILFGMACAIGLLLVVPLRVRWRRSIIGACAIGAVASLSSAPLQGIVLGLALMAYDRVLAGARWRWAALLSIAAGGIVLLLIFVGDPLGFIFRHLIADTESGYFRLYTWQMAGAALDQSPWFGLGFVMPDDYEIPATVDSVWLMSALTFGIPGSVLIGLSLLGALSLPATGRGVRLTATESRLGTTLGIIIFLIVFWGFTVHIWGTDWILIAMLAGVRAHLGALGRGAGTTGRVRAA